jgi:imidazole glycerol-phosphate synthase subunit HisF
VRPRVIPILLIHKRGLVKTVRFGRETYIGDPINAVKIFNDKEVDELIIVDIGASVEKTSIDFDLLAHLADECFMPFSYGGGVRTLDEIRKILSIGVEKISLNSAAIESPDLIRRAADLVGSQSVVVSMDVKKNWRGRYRVYIDRGKRDTGIDPMAFAKEAESQGAGEILLNSIDHDGTYAGYDLPLVREISDKVRIPVIACGGAKDLPNMRDALRAGAAGAAAGSLFVYFGPTRGILINYPAPQEIGGLLD